MQGELIDLIEKNVENASIWVYHGKKQITRAVVIHRSNKRVCPCMKLKKCTCDCDDHYHIIPAEKVDNLLPGNHLLHCNIDSSSYCRWSCSLFYS